MPNGSKTEKGRLAQALAQVLYDELQEVRRVKGYRKLVAAIVVEVCAAGLAGKGIVDGKDFVMLSVTILSMFSMANISEGDK